MPIATDLRAERPPLLGPVHRLASAAAAELGPAGSPSFDELVELAAHLSDGLHVAGSDPRMTRARALRLLDLRDRLDSHVLAALAFRDAGGERGADRLVRRGFGDVLPELLGAVDADLG